MKNLHHEMIERVRTLVHQLVELIEQFRKLELAKREIESELDAAKTYILTSHVRPSNASSIRSMN